NPKIADDEPPGGEDRELTRLLHETIKKVGEDIEALRFNTAISQMMIFINAAQKSPAVSRQTALGFLQVLAPFAPHLAEELWARLGATGSVLHAAWPQFDPTLLQVTQVKLVFQVNGKYRGDQLVPVDTDQEQALSLAQAHARVAPYLQNKPVKRVVFVRNKILNIVVE
ncbi:MAG: class I tRNA ligase family protein, partial [Verrucomicrobia bacterium]|nr:class I tRNA ligase family protein [Verrucomicrobiota bacterium]